MRVTFQEALKSKQSTSTHFEHANSENQGKIVKLTVIFLVGFIKACCAESMCLKVIEAKTPGLPSSFISDNSSFLNLTESFMPAQSPFTKMRPKSQDNDLLSWWWKLATGSPSSGMEIISASWRGPQRWDKGNMEAMKYTLTSRRTSGEVSQASPHINSFQWVGSLSWQISNIISNGTKLKIVIISKVTVKQLPYS